MAGSLKDRLYLGLTLFLAAILQGTAARAQEHTLRAVYNALGGVMAPIWVAQEGGYFTKHGVNVDLSYLAATSAVQAMVGGGQEVGFVGNQGIDAKLEGADLIYVASGLPTFVFQLYSRPEIKSLADLKGKVVAVTQPAAQLTSSASVLKKRWNRQGREDHPRPGHEQRLKFFPSAMSRPAPLGRRYR